MTMLTYTTRPESIMAVKIMSVGEKNPKKVICCDRSIRTLGTLRAKVGDYVILHEIAFDGKTNPVERWVEKTDFETKYLQGVKF